MLRSTTSDDLQIISLTTQDSMSAWSGNNSVTSTVPADASKPVAAHKQQAADVRKDVSANPDPLWSPFDWVSCSGGCAAVIQQ